MQYFQALRNTLGANNGMVNQEVPHLILLADKFNAIAKKINPAKTKIIRQTLPIVSIDSVVSLLASNLIGDMAGYFQNHRPDSPYAILDDEYKVQDLVYCLLRPAVPDLQYENPQSKPRGSLTSTRVDFTSEKTNMFLEIKHVSSTTKAKKIESEISEDITKYGRSRRFAYFVIFVYCYNYAFPNKLEFEKGFTDIVSLGKNDFETICIVN